MDHAAHKYRQQVIEQLDALIEKKAWEKSLVLKVIQGRIIAYRDALMEEVEAARPQSASSDNATKISVMPDDMQPIFVCLFKRFADSIDKWQTELSRFDGNVLGRPIYAHAEQAQQFINNKEDKRTEGYIEIWVKKDAILQLPPERVLHDKNGNPLLSLKPNAVKKENVRYFTHGEGGKYALVKGRLVGVAELS